MSKRPNILWVSFEDTNPFYGCYGDKVARTPNVDRVAAEGCIYPNAFATAGVWCAGSFCGYYRYVSNVYRYASHAHHAQTRRRLLSCRLVIRHVHRHM